MEFTFDPKSETNREEVAKRLKKALTVQVNDPSFREVAIFARNTIGWKAFGQVLLNTIPAPKSEEKAA